MEPLRSRVQRVQKVQRVQRGRYRPAGDEYKVSVTRFGIVSPVLHDEEPEPPSLGRGWRRQATEDRGVSSLLSSSDLSSGLRPAPSRSGKQKEGPS